MRRFAPAAIADDNTPALAGSWEMRRERRGSDARRATRARGRCSCASRAPRCRARFCASTATSARWSGHWQNGKLVLSHFAGERPNLFEATLDADGTLAVTLNGTAHYRVVRSGEARAKGIPEPPDPSRYTNVKDPTAPFHFAFPDLTGKLVSDTDAAVPRQGRSILAIGGSWCPNCHDEAPFLSELYKDFRATRARDRRADVRERSGSEGARGRACSRSSSATRSSIRC